MQLIKKKNSNGGLIPKIQSSLTELFDNDRFFMEPLFEWPAINGMVFSKIPAANVRESDEEYTIEIAAPGLKKGDFKIELTDSQLEISVEKKEESEKEEEGYKRREYNYSAFSRSFNLPDLINSDKVKAEYGDGILKVHLPKKPEAVKKAAKKVQVS